MALPELPALKEKWSVECKAKLADAVPRFDDDGQALALVATTGPVAAVAYNPKTGAAFARELPPQESRGRFHQMFGLDKGKFGLQADADGSVFLWDPTTGKITPRTIPTPPDAGGVPYLHFSPDTKYAAVGHARRAPGSKGGPTELRILSTATNRAVVSLDWHVGRTAFTADGARVLVVDDTDKFQWFQLPGGKSDGEWSFGRTPDGRNARLLGVSAKGEAVLYYGQPSGREEAPHLLEGKDGTVRQSFPARLYSGAAGSLSPDSQRVMLIRNDGGAAHAAEILDSRGTRLAAVKLPPGGAGADAVAVSWRAGLVVTYDRTARRLTAYELPPAPAP